MISIVVDQPHAEEQQPPQEPAFSAADTILRPEDVEVLAAAQAIAGDTASITRIVVEKPVLLNTVVPELLADPSIASGANAIVNLEVENDQEPTQVASKRKIGRGIKQQRDVQSEQAYGRRALSPHRKAKQEAERLRMAK